MSIYIYIHIQVSFHHLPLKSGKKVSCKNYMSIISHYNNTYLYIPRKKISSLKITFFLKNFIGIDVYYLVKQTVKTLKRHLYFTYIYIYVSMFCNLMPNQIYIFADSFHRNKTLHMC